LPQFLNKVLIFLPKNQTSKKREATMSKFDKNTPLFQLINCKSYEILAAKWDIDKHVRTLTTKELIGALIEAFVLRLSSTRQIEDTLGIPHSTLSDAMASRCSGFFEDLCDEILLDIRKRTENRKIRRAIRELLAIDSSECDVHGSMFERPGWAKKKGDGKTASFKLHVIWNVDQDWVEDFLITGNRKHDSPAALKLKIQSGKTYVFDRAYNDLRFWLNIIQEQSDFVTRLKDSASISALRLLIVDVIKESGDHDGVLYDGEYEPSATVANRYKGELQGIKFRHIVFRDPDTKKIFDFVTSNFDSMAEEIAAIYKRRWAVELLFRWLKGHLNIRRLPLKNNNAVEVQIAVAIMVQLLLQLKKIATQYQGTLWQLLQMIRAKLHQQGLSGTASRDGCRWSSPSAGTLERFNL
jgi:hypothetical protein